MASISKGILIGNSGRDPDGCHSQGGAAICLERLLKTRRRAGRGDARTSRQPLVGARRSAVAAVATGLALAGPAALAQGAADMQRLKAYTVLLGQADACNTNVDTGLERVATWVHRVWPQGSKDHPAAFQVWVQGTQDAARAQRRGTSGKTCEQVAREVAAAIWP